MRGSSSYKEIAMRRFARLQKNFRLPEAASPPTSGDRPSILDDFGDNPGDLIARIHVPDRLEARPAVVVVLHGCTQTAADYDRGAGWTSAADRHGFIVLFPEQQRANNASLCFNWFSPRDARRERGEARSIAQMAETVAARHDADRDRLFVTGLSAGGAMAAVMLAAYPDLFAGGAVIAGLPFATANNVPQALERMRGQELPTAETLGNMARSASDHGGPPPILSVWHGTNDATVHRSNAQAVVDQWRALHDAPSTPQRVEDVQGHVRRVWQNPAGRDVIEEYQVAGLGHGTPLSTRHEGSGEIAGPHMLEAGISSTTNILHFWGLVDDEACAHATIQPRPTAARPAASRTVQPRVASAGPSDVKATIEKALQQAGLLR